MMLRRKFLIGVPALLLAGCNRNSNPNPQCPPGTVGVWPNCQFVTPPPPPPGPPTPPPVGASAWNIGPVIGGRSYSPGMPAASPDGSFEFPVGAPNPDHSVIPSVHYVTKQIALAGKSRIRMSFEVIGNGPFKSTELPEQLPAYVCLHFQRNGDDWSGLNQFESYRWWSNDQVTLAAGVSTLEVPLQRSAWVSVLNRANDADFAAAMNDPCCVGFTFGGAGGKGHGAYCEQPGNRFVLKSYDVI
jgi:hypothetical protein